MSKKHNTRQIAQNPYTSLIINGVVYHKKALLEKKHRSKSPPSTILSNINSNQKTTPNNWQTSLQNFLSEWLNDTNFVTVQTSGSTGQPKKIKLLKKRMINSAIMTGKYFQFRKGEKALLCLPCDYIAGKMMVVRAMVWGLDLQLVSPTGNPLVEIEQVIDFAAMIPLQVQNIFEQSQEKFSLLKKIIIGGGKVNSTLLRKLQTITTECYATYGMTETITHVAIKKLNGENRTNYFQALTGINFKTDNRGCLCIHAPTLVADLVVTNDIIELKNEQQFEWLGRIDNVINTGGVKVFPEKVEAKLDHLIEQRFFITAMPDKKLENKVILIIESEDWLKEKIDTLMLELKQVLTKFERPKHIYFVAAFVETPTKKIQRNRTKEKLLRFNL